MRTIGLIGGMSWYSSAEYYRVINAEVQRRLGGHHSAELVMVSLDFDVIRACQVAGDWARAGQLLADAGRRLEQAGADVVLIGTNLMHKVAEDVETAIGVPLLHIGDAVGRTAVEAGHRTVGILGTRWVMSEPFYADRLARHGVRAVVPPEEERGMIDQIIFDELTRGIVSDVSRRRYVRVLEGLRAAGADAVVLACTEIELLIGSQDSSVPVFPTTRLHAEAAVRHALGEATT